MTTKEKVSKAKIQLILSQPFFACLMNTMTTVENNSRKHLGIAGKEIQYNADYIESLSIDEIKALICSAILRKTNFHDLRRGNRDKDTWNRAGELAVNSIVKNAGMKLPKESLIDRQFEGQAAEQIFTTLHGHEQQGNQQSQQGSQQQGQGQGQGQQSQQGQQPNNGQQNNPQPQPGQQGQGGQQQQPAAIEVDDNPGTTSEKQQQEAELKQQLAKALTIGKKAGNLPGGIEELVNDLLSSKVPWREVINRFVLDTANNDYSFSHPNVRYIDTGLFLPSLKNLEPGRIGFFIDKSGSIDLDLFKTFGGELQEVCTEIQAKMFVAYIDTEVQKTFEVEPNDPPVSWIVNPNGGTCFKPGFKFVEDNDIELKAIVYLTDGDCHSYPDTEPDVPVLWVKYGNYPYFKPPFGEVIEID